MREDSKPNRWLTAALLAPTSMWFLFLLILPLIVILVFSFGERAAVGGYAGGFTLEQYANLPSRLKAFQNTMLIAPLGTLLSLIVAYPLAYYLALRVSRRYKLLLLVLVIVPFWTSLLVRTYAWIFILGGRGIPTLLEFIGIEGVRLINTPGAVLVAVQDLYANHAAAVDAGNGNRLHAGVYPADGRISDPGVSWRRQSVLHRQCAGRFVPAVAQLAFWRRGIGHAGGHHANHGQPVYAHDDA
jgi:hypothetical protein